jgi:ABC-type Fe3+/spermidine/putrescine transport system ATPase subunit
MPRSRLAGSQVRLKVASGPHRTPPALRAFEVQKRYGIRQVLRDVSLEIRHGENVCIIGSSGSGKTTLLRCLAGKEEIDSGQIEVTVPVIFQP